MNGLEYMGEAAIWQDFFLDLAYHVMPAAVSSGIETMIGIDGERAHLAIFAGMLIVAHETERQGICAASSHPHHAENGVPALLGTRNGE